MRRGSHVVLGAATVAVSIATLPAGFRGALAAQAPIDTLKELYASAAADVLTSGQTTERASALRRIFALRSALLRLLPEEGRAGVCPVAAPADSSVEERAISLVATLRERRSLAPMLRELSPILGGGSAELAPILQKRLGEWRGESVSYVESDLRELTALLAPPRGERRPVGGQHLAAAIIPWLARYGRCTTAAHPADVENMWGSICVIALERLIDDGVEAAGQPGTGSKELVRETLLQVLDVQTIQGSKALQLSVDSALRQEHERQGGFQVSALAVYLAALAGLAVEPATANRIWSRLCRGGDDPQLLNHALRRFSTHGHGSHEFHSTVGSILAQYIKAPTDSTPEIRSRLSQFAVIHAGESRRSSILYRLLQSRDIIVCTAARMTTLTEPIVLVTDSDNRELDDKTVADAFVGSRQDPQFRSFVEALLGAKRGDLETLAHLLKDAAEPESDWLVHYLEPCTLAMTNIVRDKPVALDLLVQFVSGSARELNACLPNLDEGSGNAYSRMTSDKLTWALQLLRTLPEERVLAHLSTLFVAMEASSENPGLQVEFLVTLAPLIPSIPERFQRRWVEVLKGLAGIQDFAIPRTYPEPREFEKLQDGVTLALERL